MIIRITWWSLERDSQFYFWVLQWWSWLSGPLKSMVFSILCKIGMVKILKNLHIGLIVKKLFFQIKKLNEINFFLIITYILIQFKVFIYSPWKFMWSTDIQNTLLLVYWPSHGIAIDHSSIGLKRLTIQLVFIEAWLCVVMRFLHHNTSQCVHCNLKYDYYSSLRLSFSLWLLQNVIAMTYDWSAKAGWWMYVISSLWIDGTCTL